MIAQHMEKAGVDAILVSIGPPGFFYVPPGYHPRGCLVALAEGIKRMVRIPVITVGRIDSLDLANRIVEEGMGRPGRHLQALDCRSGHGKKDGRRENGRYHSVRLLQRVCGSYRRERTSSLCREPTLRSGR